MVKISLFLQLAPYELLGRIEIVFLLLFEKTFIDRVLRWRLINKGQRRVVVYHKFVGDWHDVAVN